MAHEVEHMAFAHEVPWHGLGTQVRTDQTLEEWRDAARLNWGVGMQPIYVEAAGGTHQRIPRHMAVMRDSDNRVFDVVSERFKPVQNESILEFFRYFCDAGGATMETLGSLKEGRIVWGLANLGTGFVLPDGDAVKGYILLQTRHEAGYATVARTTPIRVVCANTMAMAMTDGNGVDRGRFPHTEVFNPKAAAEACELARVQFSRFEKDANILRSLRISDEDAKRILLPAYQPPGYDAETADEAVRDKVNALLDRILLIGKEGPGGDVSAGTAWGVLNGVTYMHNHMARNTAGGGRFASAIDGLANRTMNKVKQDLLALAA